MSRIGQDRLGPEAAEQESASLVISELTGQSARL